MSIQCSTYWGRLELEHHLVVCFYTSHGLICLKGMFNQPKSDTHKGGSRFRMESGLFSSVFVTPQGDDSIADKIKTGLQRFYLACTRLTIGPRR